MFRILKRKESIILSHPLNQARYLRQRDPKTKSEKIQALFSEAEKNREEIFRIERIQNLLKKQYQLGKITGRREEAALQRIHFQEKHSPGSTVRKFAAWISFKENTPSKDPETELKEEFFALGYAHSQEKAFRDGKKAGYREGFIAAIEKSTQISKRILTLPMNIREGCFQFIDKLTPQKNKYMIRFHQFSSPFIQNTARALREKGCSRTEIWERRTVQSSVWERETPSLLRQKSSTVFSETFQKFWKPFQQIDQTEIKYSEGFLQGYRLGRLQGRWEMFIGIGATLGFYSFVIHLRSGQRAS